MIVDHVGRTVEGRAACTHLLESWRLLILSHISSLLWRRQYSLSSSRAFLVSTRPCSSYSYDVTMMSLLLEYSRGPYLLSEEAMSVHWPEPCKREREKVPQRRQNVDERGQ